MGDINSKMLFLIPGESQTFLSADIITPYENDDTIENMDPPKLLHSLNFSGLPNHRLKLKVDAPIILLRNFDQSLGLCNGTRMIVHKMENRVIEAKVISGSNDGEMVLIPRIVLSPSTSHSPFILKRRHFPIKLTFSMTINKSQGQTLKTAGLYLRNPVFSH